MLFYDLVVLFVNTGRLTSPLPHSEITLSMIRQVKQEFHKFMEENQDAAKGDYGKFLEGFERDFELISRIGQELEVLEVRAEDQLRSIKLKLEDGRKRLKNHPNAKQFFEKIDNYLSIIEKIRRAMRDETTRTIIDQRKIRRHA